MTTSFFTSLSRFCFLLMSVLAISSSTSFAYTIHDFDCPLAKPELRPLMRELYPEALSSDGEKFKLGWTKRLDLQVNETDRVNVVKKLYALAKEKISESSSVFEAPEKEVESDPKLSRFFETYVSAHNPRRNLKGELRQKDALLCRSEALHELFPIVPIKNTTTDESLEIKVPIKGIKNDPLSDLAIAIDNTCFAGANFSKCLYELSKATLMCTPESSRLKMKSDLSTGFEKFQETIVSETNKLVSKTEEKKHPELKTMREAHYQIRLLFTIFPSLSNEFLKLLDLEGTGTDLLRAYSVRIAQNDHLSEKEISLATSAVYSLSQACRIDYLMDVRKVIGDVLTWTSVGLTVASIAFGPVLGISLLPMVLNAGTTFGFLVGINVLGNAVNLISTALSARDMRLIFDEGKMSLLLFKAVSYEKSVMDHVIQQLRYFHSPALMPELSLHDEMEAKRKIVRALEHSDEYMRLLDLYSTLKTANFNRIKTILGLFTFALTVVPNIDSTKALFQALEAGGVSRGLDAIHSIGNHESTSLFYPVASDSNTAISGVLSATSLIYVLEGLNYAQKKFVKAAFESAFGFYPSG